jgi:uncharacterized membrane protein YsdA (DUF1294 family)
VTGNVRNLLIGYNLAVWAIYAWDKFCAQRGWRRVPERRLLLAASLGGAAGAFLGMITCRHKTRKPMFAVGVPALLLLQLALLGWGWSQGWL